jgi:hypothetical protein
VKEKRQVPIYLNWEQVKHVVKVEGIEIEELDSTKLKAAILSHYPDMPPDKPAGAPKRKPYQRKKKQ